MNFDELREQVLALVQRQGRVSYRAIKRRFDVDDDYLTDLREEILFAHPHIRAEDGRGLVWMGGASTSPALIPSVPPHEEAPHSRSVEPRHAEAERRQLTVLFCDLVDSTALARQLDPEDLREVVHAYQETCAKVIARFDGHIAQYLGDGLLVYFGYPQAHEDDAQRAVRAGLAMVETLGQLNTLLAQERGVHLAVRLGIHTAWWSMAAPGKNACTRL